MQGVDVRKRARLPHWDCAHGVYFVTFNLFDAIPRDALLRIREESEARAQHIRAVRGRLTIAEKRLIDDCSRVKAGEMLDRDQGSCFMRDARVARIVANAITHFDGQRYRLLAWCVMPNHVHAVFTLGPNQRVDAVVHSWKSFTAHRCNALLGREGDFWQDDYYDRLVRDASELRNTIDYVINNPVKAGFTDWPFVASYPEGL
jgi:REP element-mobilizing transposase RayT